MRKTQVEILVIKIHFQNLKKIKECILMMPTIPAKKNIRGITLQNRKSGKVLNQSWPSF